MSASATTTRQPTRFRPRFGLGLLFVIITVASVPLAWHALQQNERRRQKEAMLAEAQLAPHVIVSDSERRIYEVLNSQISATYSDAPLSKVVQDFKRLKIPIEIDHRALKDVGIGTDVPITRKINDLALKTALTEILRDLDLTYDVRYGEIILITTPEERARQNRGALGGEVEIRTYFVADLLEQGANAEQLASAIRDLLAEPLPSDEPYYPGCRIAGWRDCLVVRATRRGHEKVAEAIQLLRGVRKRRLLSIESR